MKKRRLLSKWIILPGIMAAMVAVLTLSFTLASLNDIETSNNNTSLTWTSANWTQTTQADFNSGVSSNVSANISIGDVTLLAGVGTGANMTLFWDGGAAPAGWTLVSEVGGAFNQKFPHGAATYGGTGGTSTHTHTVNLVSVGANATATTIRTGATNADTPAHTHTLASGSTNAVTNLPLTRNLAVISFNSTVMPTTIPAGAIAIFDVAAPTGWTRYSAEDNYFVSGNATANATGGSDNETHSVNISLGASVGTVTVDNAGTTVVASAGENATGSSTTVLVDKKPAYITVVLAKANANTAIPVGMIAMFNATPGGAWTVVSGAGQAFDSKFIRGGPSYNATAGQGSDNHTPANLGITTGLPSTTTSPGGRTNSTTTTASSRTHTHLVTVSFGNSSNIPPYINVIFAKALYVSSGKLASQVLDTNVTASRWDGLFWDNSLPASTNITFEVRSSDTLFVLTASNATLPWIPIGNSGSAATGYVISGLPGGRYKQWRATFTPNGVQTSTPILQEVRLYYYGG